MSDQRDPTQDPQEGPVDVLAVIAQLDPENVLAQINAAKERLKKLQAIYCVLTKKTGRTGPRGPNAKQRGGRDGGPTIKTRIATFLKDRGAVMVSEIAKGIGKATSSAASALSTHPELFERTDDGWRLKDDAKE